MSQWLLDHDWAINLSALLVLILAVGGLTWWGHRPPTMRELGTMSADWLRDRGLFRKDQHH